METVISRADGREDGEEWTENYEELPGGAGISIILESTTEEGVGPRLHRHPYAETFVIRRGSATFTVGRRRSWRTPGRCSSCRPRPRTASAPGPRATRPCTSTPNDRFVTEWLE